MGYVLFGFGLLLVLVESFVASFEALLEGLDIIHITVILFLCVDSNEVILRQLSSTCLGFVLLLGALVLDVSDDNGQGRAEEGLEPG
jgi:hypothetical protein